MRQRNSIHLDNDIWFVWYISNFKSKNRRQVLDRDSGMKGFKIGKLDILQSQQTQTHPTERKFDGNLNNYGE